MLEKNNIKNKFSREKRQAGKDWLYGFLKRHSKFSLRKPEVKSLNRVLAFNKEVVQLFYSNLETLITKFKFPATKIYNVYETDISTVQSPRVFSPKEMKQVGALRSWERVKTSLYAVVLVLLAIIFPPMFVFPYKRISPQLERGGPAGALYHCSPNGWMKTELFTEWLQHFVKESSASIDHPVLLIMDNRGSHMSLKSYLFCKENGVPVVSIPPHNSHQLQPLDIYYFAPLKTTLNCECDTFMKTHNSEVITPYDVAELFNKAYCRVSSLEKANKAFERSGIWPLNPNVYSDEDFVAADNLNSTNTTENVNSVISEVLQDENKEINEKIPSFSNQVQQPVSLADISPVHCTLNNTK